MEHSKNYDKVKNCVRNAVVKGWITEEEFVEITGKDYK